MERNLLLRHDYHLTISDTATVDVITQSVVDTQNHEVIIINNQLRDLTKKRRGWRTTEELRTMVFDTDGYFDTDNFRANSIDTNMLTVGSKSQQFVLSGVVIQPNYGGNANRIVISAGSLVHLTINENSARLWNLTASDTTMGNTTGYYLYARCAKSGDNGIWLVTQTRYQADPGGDYYYFLVGIIGSAYDASGGHTAYRDFTTTYGFTRINGNTITTGKIVTDDGYNYLDLDSAKFRIGDANSSMDYNVTAQNQLTMRNVKLMSGTAEDPVFSDIGVYRGVYNSSYIYYKGDEVAYTTSGYTATYRYINNTPSSGHAPTNTTYWSVVAKGKDGSPGDPGDPGVRGDFKSRVFKRTNSTPSTPTGGSYDSPVPSGWSDGIPSGTAILWSSVCTFYGGGGSSGWSTPAPETDTATLDLEFSPSTTQPSAPSGNTPFSDHTSEGWYDPSNLPSGQTMIWRAERKVKNGVYDGDWVITRINGEKGDPGDPGADGDFYELRYAKNGSPTSPPSLVVTDRNPSGWSTTQPSVATLEYLWETRAKISGTTGALLTNWTTPVRRNPVDAVNLGENLVDNSEAPENYEITSCTASSPLYYKTGKKMCKILATGTKVSGQVRVTLTGCSPKSGGGQVLVYINGSNSYPTIGEKTGIYSSTVTFDLKSEDVTYNENGGTMYNDIYIRLKNFNDGGVVTVERVKVEVGSKCTAWSLSEADKRGPAVIYRGVYDSSAVYVGSALRIDCVKYNGVYYAARYDAGEFSNHAPTDDDYWNSFGAQFESVATSLLLAEFAYIENLGVRHLLTAESGKRVHISGDDNSMTIYDSDDQASVIFSGDVFSDTDLFGGTTQTLSPTTYDGTYITGSHLHPNMTYRSTVNQCSFTTTKAGVCSGSFTAKVTANGSYTQGSGMSMVSDAKLSIYLDGVYLGGVSVAEFNGSHSAEHTFSFSKNVSIGSHVLKAVIEISNPNYSSGSYTITGKNTFSNTKVEYDFRASRYFANGNAIGLSSTQFSETLMQNSKLLHRVRSGNAGVEVYDGTFKVLIGGTWYTATTTTINGERVLKLT